MGRRVGPEAELTIVVVGVGRPAANVVRRDEQLVEAVVWRDSRAKILEELEALTRHANITKAVCFVTEEGMSLVN